MLYSVICDVRIYVIIISVPLKRVSQITFLCYIACFHYFKLFVRVWNAVQLCRVCFHN